LKVVMRSDGAVDVEKKGWKPEEVKTIIVQFKGKLTSRYKYPISKDDEITEITIRVEE